MWILAMEFLLTLLRHQFDLHLILFLVRQHLKDNDKVADIVIVTEAEAEMPIALPAGSSSAASSVLAEDKDDKDEKDEKDGKD